MTVHMVRIFVEPPKGESDNAVQNWVQNYNEWSSDPAEHALIETNTEPDGSGTTHIRGDWRFVDEGETPTNILEDLSTRLQNLNGSLWHRLVYHVCPHDENNPDPCNWDEKTEWGSVPSDIPNPEVA